MYLAEPQLEGKAALFNQTHLLEEMYTHERTNAQKSAFMRALFLQIGARSIRQCVLVVFGLDLFQFRTWDYPSQGTAN